MDITWEEFAPQLTGLAHLATASADGRPNVVVVSILVEGRVLWLGTNKLSQKAKNLASNPRASIMWQPGAEIYVQGTADLTNDMGRETAIVGGQPVSVRPGDVLRVGRQSGLPSRQDRAANGRRAVDG